MAKNKDVEKECCGKECCNNGPGNFVGIAAVLGGILLAMSIMFLIFARDQLQYLVGIAWGFVLLGVFLGLFTLISLKDKKK